ncbi:MAG: dienelactone hydrolase family protein [Sphingobacteriaceae bacterium]|nr:dienelactone hydrolase family protein [Sphingobacteriaceae bacterium]
MKKLIILFIILSNALLAQEIKTELIYKFNKPTKKSDKTPVVILLHGYGSNESDLFEICKSFDPKFMTFSLRGPYKSSGFDGASWYDLKRNNNEMSHNYTEVSNSRNKILSFISHACKAYHLDSTQVFLIGFSQGAIMCYDLAFRNSNKIKGIAALSGLLLEETKKQKNKTSELLKVNYFIAHGSMDNVISIKESQDVSKYLTEIKARLTYKEYEIPHSINGSELNDINAWLRSNLKSEKKK